MRAYHLNCLTIRLNQTHALLFLQMFTWPYKIVQDNMFRAATEIHVFVVITTALVLKNDQAQALVYETVKDTACK